MYKHESLRYGPAELTELGEKLLGLRSWRGQTDQDGAEQDGIERDGTGTGKGPSQGQASQGEGNVA